MIEVKVTSRVNDSAQSIATFASQLHPLYLTQPGLSWTLDLREARNLGPGAAATVLALYRRAQRLNQRPSVVLPSYPLELRQFCRQSGLEYSIFRTNPADAAADNNHSLAPLRELDLARHEDVDPILDLIRYRMDVPESFIEALNVAFAEVVQNVSDHSGSMSGAITCARYFPESDVVRVAIVDTGDGIYTTLKANWQDTKNIVHAMQRVTKGGFSAQSRPNNAGRGISNLKLCVEGQGGTVGILSENGLAEFKAGQKPVFQLLPVSFPGTAVHFKLPVKRIVS